MFINIEKVVIGIMATELFIRIIYFFLSDANSTDSTVVLGCFLTPPPVTACPPARLVAMQICQLNDFLILSSFMRNKQDRMSLQDDDSGILLITAF